MAGLAAGAVAPTAGPEPRRIVSLNPCLDAILVHVADRAQIAALSHYSRDPASSSIGDLGQSFPITYESAEEVVVLRPDLVLAAGHSGPATRAALKQLAIRVETFGLPNTVAQSLKQVSRIAALVHRSRKGAALIAAVETALAEAAPGPGSKPLKALVFEGGGLVSAPHTLMDELLTRCGFANAALRYGVTHTTDVPLELLVADPPEVLLAGQGAPGAPTWADRVVSHPALARTAKRMYRASFPQHLTYCGGPVIAETARTLADIRRRAEVFRAEGAHG